MAANLVKTTKALNNPEIVNLDETNSIGKTNISALSTQSRPAEYSIVFGMRGTGSTPPTIIWRYTLQADRDADYAGLAALATAAS